MVWLFVTFFVYLAVATFVSSFLSRMNSGQPGSPVFHVLMCAWVGMMWPLWLVIAGTVLFASWMMGEQVP